MTTYTALLPGLGTATSSAPIAVTGATDYHVILDRERPMGSAILWYRGEGHGTTPQQARRRAQRRMRLIGGVFSIHIPRLQLLRGSRSSATVECSRIGMVRVFRTFTEGNPAIITTTGGPIQ